MATIEANKTSVVDCPRDCLYLRCGDYSLSCALTGDKIQIITDTKNGTFQGSLSYQQFEDALVLALLRKVDDEETHDHEDVKKELG